MPTTWSDLRGRRVGVWGLGVEGRASVRKLLSLDVDPVLVDERAGEAESRPVLAARDGGLAALASCDAVVKSPGISRYSDELVGLEASGVPVLGGLGLWLNGTDRRRVLCVTGTKGKSTTTAIAGALVRGTGLGCLVGGNIGFPPWDPGTSESFDWAVIETSSYQALDVELGPAVVAVTSLSEDHLPWHAGSVQRYFEDKLSICRRPGVRVVVADGGDALLRRHAELLGPNVTWVDRDAGDWVGGAPLFGRHNRRNAEVARAALDELGVPGMLDDEALASAFRAFEPLPSRLARVADIDGVLFVDDSISTNALSAAAAVEAFHGRRTALLVGGLERSIDYGHLARAVSGRPVKVFTMPTNGPTIARALRCEGVTDVEDCASLSTAVAAASAWARPDGVVLLSPAAASFDLFDDYRARSRAFASAVSSLGA